MSPLEHKDCRSISCSSLSGVQEKIQQSKVKISRRINTLCIQKWLNLLYIFLSFHSMKWKKMGGNGVTAVRRTKTFRLFNSDAGRYPTAVVYYLSRIRAKFLQGGSRRRHPSRGRSQNARLFELIFRRVPCWGKQKPSPPPLLSCHKTIETVTRWCSQHLNNKKGFF